ncbi:hypothetical protein BUALT_Bualt03G0037600 [Buddleja alternifolia]|uniref:Uncharacterized protein n=1 Tax=Buddleja alternifolia TaxID=168488 RepID=A0AAV6XQU4_9LAMI|nr:hypothetical protein BUALT_Bualt03G0037600 [Buddleja alternifolia]
MADDKISSPVRASATASNHGDGVLDIIKEKDTLKRTSGKPSGCSSSRFVTVPFLQKMIAEALGTYFLIFAGCAAVVVNADKDKVVTLPGIAIVWGLAVMVMIYAVGHISGAHFNPAVTIAFATCNRFSICLNGTSLYLGSTPGINLSKRNLTIIVPRTPLPLRRNTSDRQRRAISDRGIYYDILPHIGELAGLAVGSTILLNVLISGAISGGSLNPARSLGPAIVSNNYKGIWIYLVGPTAGAIAGAWIYNIIRFTDRPLHEITLSASFLQELANGNQIATAIIIKDDDNHTRSNNEYSEDSNSGRSETITFIKKLTAEFMGTYLLLLAGFIGGVVNNEKNNMLTFPGVALLWGLDVMIMIYTVGHLSGAHFNPAVTFAFATCKRFAWKYVPAYISVQMLASTLASITIQIMFGSQEENFVGTLPSGSNIQSLVLEFIITFYLMFAVSGIATDPRGTREMSGLALGATVTMNSLLAGPISGASMNPARSLGPAIVFNKYRGIWIYIVGPTAGALAGVWFYNLIRLKDKFPPLKEEQLKTNVFSTSPPT